MKKSYNANNSNAATKLQELADNMWDQGLAIGPSYPRAPSYVSAAAQTLATTAAIAGG